VKIPGSKIKVKIGISGTERAVKNDREQARSSEN
jgi:hypothetical protein